MLDLRVPEEEHLEKNLGTRTPGPLAHLFVLQAEPLSLAALHPQQGDHHLSWKDQPAIHWEDHKFEGLLHQIFWVLF